MKISKSLMLGLWSASLFFACGSNTTSKEETSESATVADEACTYSYISDSTKLKWTAYKFTKKTGVSGTFDQIVVSNTKSADSPVEVLAGSEFNISTASVNSGNLERDPKLVSFFFNQLVGTDIIGKINSINNGDAVVSITMNGKTVDIVGKLMEEGNRVTLTASVDMTDFEGLDAVTSLNEVCSAKHTDEDGESKLWPDVDIVVSTVLRKECK